MHRSLLAAPLLALVATGCHTPSNGRPWGRDARLVPGIERLGASATHAFLDPWTWVPVAGGLVLRYADLDQDLADWARDHGPLFGSPESAKDGADLMRDTLVATAVVTSLATGSGEGASAWTVNKASGLAVGGGAFLLTGLSSTALEDWSDRTGPDGVERSSFPSSGTAQAFAARVWSSHALEGIDMSDGDRGLVRFGLGTLAVGEAWARVEAQTSYPTDVLAGAAVGNFVTGFVHEAFLDYPGAPDFSFEVGPGRDSFQVGLTWGF